MRWLLQLSRFALVCNVFFVIAFMLRFFRFQNNDAASTVLIIGWLFVFIINPLVNFFYLFFFCIRNRRWRIVPAWLVAANAVFLLVQLMFVLFLNKGDTI